MRDELAVYRAGKSEDTLGYWLRDIFTLLRDGQSVRAEQELLNLFDVYISPTSPAPLRFYEEHAGNGTVIYRLDPSSKKMPMNSWIIKLRASALHASMEAQVKYEEKMPCYAAGRMIVEREVDGPTLEPVLTHLGRKIAEGNDWISEAQDFVLKSELEVLAIFHDEHGLRVDELDRPNKAFDLWCTFPDAPMSEFRNLGECLDELSIVPFRDASPRNYGLSLTTFSRNMESDGLLPSWDGTPLPTIEIILDQLQQGVDDHELPGYDFGYYLATAIRAFDFGEVWRATTPWDDVVHLLDNPQAPVLGARREKLEQQFLGMIAARPQPIPASLYHKAPYVEAMFRNMRSAYHLANPIVHPENAQLQIAHHLERAYAAAQRAAGADPKSLDARRDPYQQIRDVLRCVKV